MARVVAVAPALHPARVPSSVANMNSSPRKPAVALNTTPVGPATGLPGAAGTVTRMGGTGGLPRPS